MWRYLDVCCLKGDRGFIVVGTNPVSKEIFAVELEIWAIGFIVITLGVAHVFKATDQVSKFVLAVKVNLPKC